MLTDNLPENLPVLPAGHLFGYAGDHRAILIVPDIATVEAARDVFTSYQVCTWIGGPDTIDWPLIFGPMQDAKISDPDAAVNVDFWPAHEQADYLALHKLAQTLYAAGADRVRVFHNDGKPAGWTVLTGLNDGMTGPELVAFARRDGGKYVRIAKKFHREKKGRVVEALREDPGAASSIAKARDAGLACASNGLPQCNEDNVIRILTYEKAPYHYDEFMECAVHAGRTLNSGDYARLLIRLQREYGMPKLTLSKVAIALDAYIQEHTGNIAQDWLRSLQWDATPRLASLCPMGFGTADDEYYRAVGRCFFMGMVKRVLEPGCEVKAMPVLEGAENIGKTRALQIIGGEWYGACNEKILDKDFLQLMPGKMLLNISEMHSFSRTEVARMKAIISTPRDRYRPTHGRKSDVQDFPRHCVFAADTNRDDYNTSDTGACRLWPVACGHINLKWLTENREQLFAEAVALVDLDGCWWDVPVLEQAGMVAARYVDDPWRHYVAPWLTARPYTRPEEVLELCIGVAKDRQDSGQINRIRSILRLEGWRSQAVWEGGKAVRAWCPPRIPSDDIVPTAPEQADLEPF